MKIIGILWSSYELIDEPLNRRYNKILQCLLSIVKFKANNKFILDYDYNRTRWSGLDWYGLDWLGLAWFGLNCFGGSQNPSKMLIWLCLFIRLHSRLTFHSTQFIFFCPPFRLLHSFIKSNSLRTTSILPFSLHISFSFPLRSLSLPLMRNIDANDSFYH